MDDASTLPVPIGVEIAPAVVKTWLLAQIEKKQRAPSADIAETSPDVPFVPERLAA